MDSQKMTTRLSTQNSKQQSTQELPMRIQDLPMLTPSKESEDFNAGYSCSCAQHLVISRKVNYIPIIHNEGLYYCDEGFCKYNTDNDSEDWELYLQKVSQSSINYCTQSSVNDYK